MPQVAHLDPSTPMPAQLQEKTGPIVLVNTFFVPREAMDEFLELWGADARVMKSQPGFISTQMHRGTAGSQLLVNIAVWESTEALAKAHSSPEFRAASSKLPDGVIAHPHVFEKIAVEGVCVA
ncbi:antibiotic biosynthesis monooxygenase family protein [Streptomyces sp. NBC_01803]|uniref:antibiotic biosynthesis monooxygenase family protein n=1 Tax=Streptomyces sp. NBC_01803 TaxID=2975946 RepID=UPI002DDBE8A2|nr:antibiotic biosynthesis monooxygenase family protein [Streptomyces sp. NBC_01803]WSA47004.1 antibiotic biosynthesis monooxygenase [Streptomyces sp. NBC_01803]